MTKSELICKMELVPFDAKIEIEHQLCELSGAKYVEFFSYNHAECYWEICEPRDTEKVVIS